MTSKVPLGVADAAGSVETLTDLARLLPKSSRHLRTSSGRCRRGRLSIRPLETETGLQIADVLGRGNARLTILIHETPPAWLGHARYVSTGGVAVEIGRAHV